MNRENKKKHFKKGIIKHMHVRIALPVSSADAWWSLQEPEATTATTARTAFRASMWT